MNKDNIMKLTLISFVTMLILTILGVTYAYFTLDIEGTPKDIVMSSGDLRLEYKDETELKLDGAFPGDTITKVITVTNIGTMNASYSLYLGNLINTIEKNELSISLDCKSYTNYNETTKAESGTCNGGKKVIPVSEAASSMTIKDGISIEPNITQEYTVTITFKETKKEQNYNKNKKFSGQIGIGKSTLPEPVYCTFDGELTQGVEYVNGQYTYRYMQEGTGISNTLAWTEISSDGWGVQLTDKTSTEAVTSEVCTYINDKPIVSTSRMFSRSQASSIDLSNFNTSTVTNMNYMFNNAQITTLDLSNLDTSNVTNMSGMFFGSKILTLDLSGFNTSNVIIMSDMFAESQTKTIDLSNFDTSNVNSMSHMFYNSQATILDISGFNTSNVTTMWNMFAGSKASTLDLSNFDTSNVTDMNSMFNNSQATMIDVTSFDTSNVTNMNQMFASGQITTIDVSNFNTSKTTHMYRMFYGSQVATIDVSNFDTSNVTTVSEMFSNCTNLKTIYASNKFVTTSATNITDMFKNTTNLVGGSGTIYDDNNVDATYARIDGGISSPGYFTSK